MPGETKFVLGVIGAWFCLALAVGIAGGLEQASAIKIAGTVWGLTALALLFSWLSQSGRDWVANADVTWLITPHLARFVGIYFLVLGSRGALPSGFARPAGIGDLIIAIFAALMLLVRAMRRRRVLLVWNVAGLIDIVFVAVAALRFGLHDWGSMAPLRRLPLMLLPTFAVPLIIASHVLIFVWLRRAGQLRSVSIHSPVASMLERR